MKTKNIDFKVIFLFATFFLIGIIWIIIQLFNSVECENAKYYVFADNFQNQESIEFYDKTPNAKSWEWDFGDGSIPDSRRHTFHVYKKPGDYYVTLTLNGSCVNSKRITIKNKIVSIDESSSQIITPKIITAGQPTYIRAESDVAKTWEWTFGENRGIDETVADPVYTFETAGEKTITLIINGDFSNIIKKVVYVHPKVIQKTNPLDVATYVYEKKDAAFNLPRGTVKKDPLEEMLQYVPVAPRSKVKKDSIIALKKAPKISEDQFEILLNKVAEGSKVKDDFAEYMCNDLDIPVVKNDTDLLTFTQLCAQLKGQKIKIESIRLNKDKQNNCIKGLSISYKVKKYLMWVKN